MDKCKISVEKAEEKVSALFPTVLQPVKSEASLLGEAAGINPGFESEPYYQTVTQRTGAKLHNLCPDCDY